MDAAAEPSRMILRRFAQEMSSYLAMMDKD
jgi:hypothetical protein